MARASKSDRSLAERLRKYWAFQGLPVRPGMPEDGLAEFEVRYRVRLPPDLRAYFGAMNGTGRYGSMDKSGHCWWSLDEVRPASEEWPEDSFVSDPETLFIFADHLINAPSYATRITPDGKANPIAAIWSDSRKFQLDVVASSFTELMQRYLRDETLH